MQPFLAESELRKFEAFLAVPDRGQQLVPHDVVRRVHGYLEHVETGGGSWQRLSIQSSAFERGDVISRARISTQRARARERRR